MQQETNFVGDIILRHHFNMVRQCTLYGKGRNKVLGGETVLLSLGIATAPLRWCPCPFLGCVPARLVFPSVNLQFWQIRDFKDARQHCALKLTGRPRHTTFQDVEMQEVGGPPRPPQKLSSSQVARNQFKAQCDFKGVSTRQTCLISFPVALGVNDCFSSHC
jgi:hypothetical protein